MASGPRRKLFSGQRPDAPPHSIELTAPVTKRRHFAHISGPARRHRAGIQASPASSFGPDLPDIRAVDRIGSVAEIADAADFLAQPLDQHEAAHAGLRLCRIADEDRRTAKRFSIPGESFAPSASSFVREGNAPLPFNSGRTDDARPVRRACRVQSRREDVAATTTVSIRLPFFAEA